MNLWKNNMDFMGLKIKRRDSVEFNCEQMSYDNIDSQGLTNDKQMWKAFPSPLVVMLNAYRDKYQYHMMWRKILR